MPLFDDFFLHAKIRISNSCCIPNRISGHYFVNSSPNDSIPESPECYDIKLAMTLWRVSGFTGSLSPSLREKASAGAGFLSTFRKWFLQGLRIDLLPSCQRQSRRTAPSACLRIIFFSHFSMHCGEGPNFFIFY